MTILERVQNNKLIAIVRGLQPEHMLMLADALYAGGIDFMEVTFNQAKPETFQDTTAAIKLVGKVMEGKMLIGAGTIITCRQLDMACEAGARYIITPNTNPDLIRRVKNYGLTSFPGALTPSEIYAAYEAGADAVKVFPAGNMGPAYIKAIRTPLNHIPLLAVGGVNEKNAADFLAAGCCGLGIGGDLINKEWVETGEWEKITKLAKKYRKAVG